MEVEVGESQFQISRWARLDGQAGVCVWRACVRVCVRARVCCSRNTMSFYIICEVLCTYLIDLVKCGVLTLVGEIRQN